MKPIEIVSIFVRFFAVILVLSTLSVLLRFAQEARGLSLSGIPLSEQSSLLLLGAAMVLVLLAIALLFWLFPTRIAGLIVPKGINSEIHPSFTAEQLEVVLLSFLGVWVLVEAIPGLAQLGVWFAAAQTTGEEVTQGWQGLVLRLVQIAIGVFLVLRIEGIRRILSGLRKRVSEQFGVDG